MGNSEKENEECIHNLSPDQSLPTFTLFHIVNTRRAHTHIRARARAHTHTVLLADQYLPTFTLSPIVNTRARTRIHARVCTHTVLLGASAARL